MNWHSARASRCRFPLINLADLYRKQGRYEQAEPIYLRALHLWEQKLGREHPQVAFPLTGLATLYREQGHYSKRNPFTSTLLLFDTSSEETSIRNG